MTSAALRAGGQTWTVYAVQDGLADNSIKEIATGPGGAVWFATAAGTTSYIPMGAASSKPKPTVASAPTQAPAPSPTKAAAKPAPAAGGTWTSFTEADGLAKSEVKAVAVGPAPRGVAWFGTNNGGLSRFDGSSWKTYTKNDGLAYDVVQALAVAPDGTVWAGTYGAGVSRFDGGKWTTYTPNDGLVNGSVNGITVAPDGAVWFACYKGVSRYAPSSASAAGPVVSPVALGKTYSSAKFGFSVQHPADWSVREDDQSVEISSDTEFGGINVLVFSGFTGDEKALTDMMVAEFKKETSDLVTASESTRTVNGAAWRYLVMTRTTGGIATQSDVYARVQGGAGYIFIPHQRLVIARHRQVGPGGHSGLARAIARQMGPA